MSVFGCGLVFGAAESLAKLSSVLNKTNVSDIGDELGKYQGCIVDSSRVDYYEILCMFGVFTLFITNKISTSKSLQLRKQMCKQRLAMRKESEKRIASNTLGANILNE